MAYKPEIQYVGQFFVHGSEAPKLDPLRIPKPDKKQQKQRKEEQGKVIAIDPIALCGLVAAVAMLVTLAIGAIQIKTAWQEYDRVSHYVAQLKRTNAELDHTYRTGYDIEEIRTTALAIGMVPATEAKTIILKVTIPEPEPQEPWWEETAWFLKGLFA